MQASKEGANESVFNWNQGGNTWNMDEIFRIATRFGVWESCGWLLIYDLILTLDTQLGNNFQMSHHSYLPALLNLSASYLDHMFSNLQTVYFTIFQLNLMNQNWTKILQIALNSQKLSKCWIFLSNPVSYARSRREKQNINDISIFVARHVKYAEQGKSQKEERIMSINW